jgi:DNA-binding response OmpR family regulator/EAL domain-containing protein (putative c-di-GMP-specific phosphodiesterase class I)
MTTVETQTATLLLSELPEIVQKIEANWPILPSGIWNSSSIQKLSRHLNDLALRSERAGEVKLNRLILDIEAALHQIIGSNAPPDSDQLETLNQFLANLRHMATISPPQDPVQTVADQAITDTHQAITDTHPFDLIYLSHSGDESERLLHAIERAGLRHLRLSDPQRVLTNLDTPGAKTLLLDAAFLNSPLLEPVLLQLKSHPSTAPTLFMICDHCTIEIRLTALRAGADQLFSKPLEADQLLDAVQSAIHPQPKPRHRVLIVEDDKAQASFASELLRKGGMDTLAITDPLGVMQVVSRFQPDLILMDLYMPGADGIELTRVIRDRWELAYIPVLFLSGEDDPDKKLLALHAGADDFLTKPVRPQQLLATVNTRIERAKQITAVAIKQAEESSGLRFTRRELLTHLDLVLGAEAPPSGYGALLAIQRADPSAFENEHGNPVSGEHTHEMLQTILPLLQADDMVTELDSRRLVLLIRRNNEVELESLAEHLFETLTSHTEPPDRIGIGMVLLDGVERNAYQQLCRVEACAESACRQGVRGFELYGESPATPAKTHDTDSSKRQIVEKSLREDSLAFIKQRYSSRKENAPETYELIPLPLPSLPSEEPFQVAASCGLTGALDRLVCHRAVMELGDLIETGKVGRLIFRQSTAVIQETDYLEFLKTELRRRQIVGTGLMVEFHLPSLAANLKPARQLIGELKGLGLGVALSHFACNQTAYKVLAYLGADAIRPHQALLRIDDEKVPLIASQVHSLHAEVILPRVTRHQELSLQWSGAADYVQADFNS